MKEGLIRYLENFINPNRIQLINNNLKLRTRYITIVIEEIFQSHNASAILRTCDCLGIQDVHIIENKNKYQINPEVTLGSEQWLNIYKYNQQENITNSVIADLKNKGYRIVATSPYASNTSLEEFDLNKGKAAFIFGTELSGISDSIKENADEFLKIPMFGFTGSFNVSVSAAIILHYITLKLRQSSINWKIPDNELNEIRLDWLKNSLKNAEMIEKYYYENILKQQSES